MGAWDQNTWTTYRRRNAIERATGISMTIFSRLGLTDQSGLESNMHWGEGANRKTLNFSIHSGYQPNTLTLSLESLECGEDKDFKLIGQEVPLTSVPANFGGRRWFFACPLKSKDPAKPDETCARRCSVLYLRGGDSFFGCRKCLDLSYSSGSKRRPSKAANNLFEKLMKNTDLIAQALSLKPNEIDQTIELLKKAGLMGKLPKMSKS